MVAENFAPPNVHRTKNKLVVLIHTYALLSTIKIKQGNLNNPKLSFYIHLLFLHYIRFVSYHGNLFSSHKSKNKITCVFSEPEICVFKSIVVYVFVKRVCSELVIGNGSVLSYWNLHYNLPGVQWPFSAIQTNRANRTD